MRTLSLLAPICLLFAVAISCTSQPCNSYVDYMCECHADDTGFDCQELQRVYNEADASIQDQCVLDLSDQKAADETAGESCE